MPLTTEVDYTNLSSYGPEPWPDWVSGFRPHQAAAVEEIMDGYARGKKVMVLDAPVGSGKTLIAEMVRRRLAVEGLEGADGSMLYVAHSRGLQAQFLADFPAAKVLMGKSNYSTRDGPAWVNCGDCTATRGKTTCKWCVETAACPYKVAKQQAKAARIAVVNTAYMLAEAQTPGALCSRRSFVCVDECDTLEGILSGAVEFGVRERDMAGLGELKKGVHGKTIASWVRDDWIAAARDEVSRMPVDGGGDVKAARRRAALMQRMSNAVRAAKGIEEGGWVRDYSYGWGLMLKPVTVDWCGQDRVWRHGERWLMMSGTVVDAETMCSGLGLERGEWEVVEVPMTFARENRLVRVAPVADMSRKALEAGWDREMGALRDALWVVLERHAGENVLVHTVSYKLNAEVCDVVRDWAETRAVVHPEEGETRVHTYMQASDRDMVLEDFKHEGGVLVGPSLDRGVDLPGDLCRVQVIVKVPFPNLGDRQVAERARGEGGSRWYAAETARTVVQMTGRGVRGSEDWCVSYVLDRQFMRWWNGEGKRLLPRWWRDAMVVELVRGYR